eukprot:4253915-Amphidinium_carterae.1
MAAMVAELHVFNQHNFTSELVQQFALLRRLEIDERRLEMEERTVDIAFLKVDSTDLVQQVGAVIVGPLIAICSGQWCATRQAAG